MRCSAGTISLGAVIVRIICGNNYNSIQENPKREFGDELNADMSSSFGGDVRKPRPLERGGRHR